MKKTIYTLLVSSTTITLISAQLNPTLVKQLSGVLPQKVTAQEVALETVRTDNITQEQRQQFAQHLRAIMIDAAELIQEYWNTIKDLVSENGRGSSIKYYVSALNGWHERLKQVIAKNNRFDLTKVHPAHRQMTALTKTLLADLSDAVEIVKSVLENKKLYQRKNSKKLSASKLGKELRDRLAKYAKQQASYLKKVAYLWNLTVEAGHIGAVDPLAKTVSDIYNDYQANKKLFSAEHMVVAIQHKLKNK